MLSKSLSIGWSYIVLPCMIGQLRRPSCNLHPKAGFELATTIISDGDTLITSICAVQQAATAHLHSCDCVQHVENFNYRSAPIGC